MEQFEELNSSDPLSDHRLYQDVDELESEAFNRGLPEKEMTPLRSGENGLVLGDEWAADDFNHAEPAGSAPVVLLIDDEKAFRGVLRQVLSKAGYDVVEAANGA